MSVTADQAFTAIRDRLTDTGSGISTTLYWQGDDPPTLPDDPTAFAFIVFSNEGSGGRPAAFGGGQGRNLYRNRGLVEAYTFSPIGSEIGADKVMARAETIAARLRSFRSSEVSFFAADVIYVGPGSAISVPGLTMAVSNYQCAVAECSFNFDQIG
jgi:hypothetical protein